VTSTSLTRTREGLIALLVCALALALVLCVYNLHTFTMAGHARHLPAIVQLLMTNAVALAAGIAVTAGPVIKGTTAPLGMDTFSVLRGRLQL
jgi:hypothetical protein